MLDRVEFAASREDRPGDGRTLIAGRRDGREQANRRFFDGEAVGRAGGNGAEQARLPQIRLGRDGNELEFEARRRRLARRARPAREHVAKEVVGKRNPVASVAARLNRPAPIGPPARVKRDYRRIRYVSEAAVVLNPHRRARKHDAIRRRRLAAREGRVVDGARERAGAYEVAGEQQAFRAEEPGQDHVNIIDDGARAIVR
ncbi:MAG TPA: hypothetical protein VI258_00615 [Rhodanobacteraceae bacterium]